MTRSPALVHISWSTAVGGLLAAACGDSGATSASAGATTTGVTSLTDPGVPTSTSSAGTTGTASAEGSGGATDTGSSGASSGDGTTVGVKYDLAAPDLGRDCGCGMGGDASHIWIANAAEGTVAKIDTRTLVEEGRYITRPDGMGNPSRTSVALSGTAVAVANRAGGVVKIWSRTSLCADTNGEPGIQSSSGADDILAWGDDECVAWYTEFPDYTTQRPVAWAGGTLDERTCTYTGEKLWTAGSTGDGGVFVHRLDGDSGAVEDTVMVPEVSGAGVGAYGGATDAAGNFWWARLEEPTALVRVDAVSLAYEVVALPGQVRPYGITVDDRGRVWVSDFTIDDPNLAIGAARYDPETQTWATTTSMLPISSEGGLQQDGEGRMWVALFNYGAPVVHAVTWIDVETMEAHEPPVLIDGGVIFKGISIDIDGYVWAVDQTTAYKIDPTDFSYETYDGLTGPYTYSDMTGWALQNAVCTPQR